MRKKAMSTRTWLKSCVQRSSLRVFPWTRIFCVSSLLFFVSTPGWAGGLYTTEFGTPSTGVANAGAVAVANDASTAWHNPAGMTHVSGTQFNGSAGLLIPNIKFDADSDTPVAGGDGGQAGNTVPIIGSSFVHSLRSGAYRPDH